MDYRRVILVEVIQSVSDVIQYGVDYLVGKNSILLYACTSPGS